MANNRDPRKQSRINRKRLTSSSDRAARSRASAKDTPRPTTSAKRPTGTGAKVTTSGSGNGGARVTQGMSARGRDAKRFQRLTGGNIQGNTGRNAPKGNPPPRGNTPNPRTAGGNLMRNGIPNKAAKNVAKRGIKAAAKAAGRSVLKGLAKPAAGAAALFGITEGLFPRSVADGTLKGKPNVQPSKASKSIGKYNTRDKDGTIRSRKKVGPKKVGTEAQSFDRSFAAARKAGKKTFTWKGKSYTTKMK